MRQKTAQRPRVSVYLLACLFAAAIVAAAEGALRRETIAKLLPRPVRTPSIPHLGHKIDLLDARLARGERFDCLLLGSSAVHAGVLPEALSAAYERETGRPIRCFNFGLIGAHDPGVASVAGLLARRYRPALLLIGTISPVLLGSRDRSDDPLVGDFERALAADPWFRLQLGEPSIEGWLIERSLAYRSFRGITSGGRHRGFAPDLSGGWRASPQDGSLPRARECRERPDLVRRQLVALEEAARIAGAGRVAFIEMPLRNPVCAALGTAAVAALSRRLDALGAPFFQLENVALPADGWTDDRHLNHRGAEEFSRWLGRRLAAAALGGEIARSGG